jgi:hypothetical protein
MWGLGIFTTIMLIGLGIAIGMYIASQISEHIECRTGHKKLMKNLENFDKNKKKK